MHTKPPETIKQKSGHWTFVVKVLALPKWLTSCVLFVTLLPTSVALTANSRVGVQFRTWCDYKHTHAQKNTSDTHIRLTALFLSIRWAICKSAPRSRQVTMPVPHHSVFYRPDALPAAQPTASKHWRHVRNKFLILAVANSGSGMWGVVSNSLCIKLKMDTGKCCSHHLISSIRTIKNIQSTDPHKKINEWPRYVGKSIFLTACVSGAPVEVTLLESNNDLWYKKMRVQWWHASLHAWWLVQRFRHFSRVNR